ncbi:MAG TPA: CDP-diacylglycerol--glycerol-3-phosphate 3-phosphatidyltransferase [Gemmataceae bacterium]|nr:CDP-diacylglycerol--glycerol-3-phosphate 3-phosphatidyltransferase [Gemmataceae bacterium]
MSILTPPQRPRVWNLPNQLTASRFVLALVLFALIAAESWLWCLVVFIVAAFTDWLDGYLARKQNLMSTLGRLLDPLVDKVLMCGVYICLLPIGVQQGWLRPWMVTVVVGRELVITGLRSWMEAHGARFGADWLGKFKMGLQCAAVIAVFVAFLAPETASSVSAFFAWVRDVLIWSMTVATLLSGLQYIWKAAMLLSA